jgi:transketolase
VTTKTDIDTLSIDTIRMLSIDAVQKANSGHPGMPLGAAPLTYALWDRFLRHSPSNPHWPDRDRFVLSAGHASMLLYSMLYLTGYGLTLDDIKQFRQWGSRTPGHPEYGHTTGIETTTGPLGQGFGNAVGFAMAAKHLAGVYNRPGHEIVTHRTYVLCSDGDMMEGISHEAASLAGHLGLGQLIAFYDSNNVTLDGPAGYSFGDNTGERFEAYGWHVQRLEDGMDADAVSRAIEAAQAVTDKPSLIICRTVIGYGSPNKEGKSSAHGSPLGADEVKLVKKFYGWDPEQSFVIPEEALQHMRGAIERGKKLEADWQQRFAAYEKAYPDLAAQWQRTQSGALPDGWDADVPVFTEADGATATRDASGKAFNALATHLPELFGGSADLSESTRIEVKNGDIFERDNPAGRNVYYGVREHAMGAAVNGMYLHGGVRPFGATFLAFYDYMRPPVRLAALMKIPSIFVYTHDSVGLGEDGPTHQPIEQVAGLRSVPQLWAFRPGDANETAEAWKFAIQSKDNYPVAFVLSRQKLPILDQQKLGKASGTQQGAYVLADAEGGAAEAIIIATGSEVQLALAAREQLAGEGIRVRVVSMPCMGLFRHQPQAYRDSVLPPAVTARVSVEALSPQGWHEWVGPQGAVLGIDHYGASAPGEKVLEEFGFTAANVAKTVKTVLGR